MDKDNLRQADVARGTGIDRSYLNRLIKGTARWNQDHIDKVAKFFNLSSSQLLENAKSPGTPGATTKPDYQLFDAEILRMSLDALEVFERSIPLKILPARRTCILQKLYEHWLVEKERPTPELAKKYFFHC